MKITILKAEKDIVTLKTWAGEEIIQTVAVAYTAKVEVGECIVQGSFRFCDESIDEIEAKQKISCLFLGGGEND